MVTSFGATQANNTASRESSSSVSSFHSNVIVATSALVTPIQIINRILITKEYNFEDLMSPRVLWRDYLGFVSNVFWSETVFLLFFPILIILLTSYIVRFQTDGSQDADDGSWVPSPNYLQTNYGDELRWVMREYWSHRIITVPGRHHLQGLTSRNLTWRCYFYLAVREWKWGDRLASQDQPSIVNFSLVITADKHKSTIHRIGHYSMVDSWQYDLSLRHVNNEREQRNAFSGWPVPSVFS